MEQKNVIAWDLQKGERTYRLELPMDAPLGEAYDVAREYLSKVIELIKANTDSKREEDSATGSEETADAEAAAQTE